MNSHESRDVALVPLAVVKEGKQLAQALKVWLIRLERGEALIVEGERLANAADALRARLERERDDG